MKKTPAAQRTPTITTATAARWLDAEWRAAREAAQEEALPSGRVVVSCPAPFGAGGLGRHLQEIADALDRRGPPAECLCGPAREHMSVSPSSHHHELHMSGLATALRPLTRFSPAWSSLRHSVAFDRCAAERLPPGDHLIAFNGQALRQLAAARRAGLTDIASSTGPGPGPGPGAGAGIGVSVSVGPGALRRPGPARIQRAAYESVSLLSANPHLRRVVHQHEVAHRQYPIEGSWATRLLRRNLREYELADRIYVASRYTWSSFAEEGYPEDRLALFPFLPDPRFRPEPPSGAPPGTARRADTFDVVFTGRLCVAKGVPLLVDAVRRLPHPDLRLILVGGWSSRGMRRFLARARAADPRIEIGPGDPLPRLRRAGVCAHPSYEDGFAYAPAEALACGVPVLISEDTGMKDLVEPGVNGLVLPTGDLTKLTEAIDAAYRGEILARALTSSPGQEQSRLDSSRLDS